LVSFPNNPGPHGSKPAAARPTLSGKGSRAAPEPAASILHTLEQGTIPAKGDVVAEQSKSRRLWLVLALAVVVALGWWAAQPRSVAPPGDRLAQAGSAAPANRVLADAVMPPAQAQPGASAAAAATLENLPEAQAAASSAQTASAPTHASADSAPAAAAAAVAVAASAPTTTAAAPARDAGARKSSSPQRSPARAAAPYRTAQGKPPAARVATRRAAPSGDPDVDLMAALMNHMGGPAAAGGSAALPGRGTGSAIAAALPSAEQATIAGLVSSCRTKPKAEADACRQQICKGYWGKAEACPARKPTTGAQAVLPTAVAAGAIR
jgi:hypothetical protein